MLPEDTLAALKRRAEEALAIEGVARTHLGYDMLVKLKLDELVLEARYEDGHPSPARPLNAVTSEDTPTSCASDGGGPSRRSGEILHVGLEATRHDRVDQPADA